MSNKAFPRIFATVLVALVILSLSATATFANPDDAVPPQEDGTIGIFSGSGNANREPDDNEKGIEDGEQVRDPQGIVSQLSTTTHNPYNGQIRLDIDIGSEFATFAGCDVTEGIRVKVTPGGIVELPPLRARDGYYFVGWGQGGVPYEPTWDPFVTEVEMDTDTSNGKNTSIFALYADEEGNGYCTCGAYEQGVYTEKMDEIKRINEEYNKTLGYKDTNKTVKLVIGFSIIALCALLLALAGYRDYLDGKRGDTEYL